MQIIIYQISERSNKKRIINHIQSRLYQPFEKGAFNFKEYQIVHIYKKFWDIPKSKHKEILDLIEKTFESFYAFNERNTVGIIPSDVVTIGGDVYYYNGDTSEVKWQKIM